MTVVASQLVLLCCLMGVMKPSEPHEALLDELRPVAFAIAYRMLGSVSEAEDVVQEALLRVHQALDEGEELDSPHAFVATVTTRLAINELRSARARRERYFGEWLPEPIITDGEDDPARHAETADSLSLAMLVLLESLSPEQRAVLLLHDVFDYGYPEIAAIVGKSEENARQLGSRARRHVEERRPRFQTTREQRDELAARFFEAAEQGDLAGLEALLAHDVELTGDGGGKVPALAQSLHGRSRVARMVASWLGLDTRIPGVLRPVEVNGGPGALFLDRQEQLLAVLALDIAGGEVREDQLGGQPREADAPRAGGRLRIAGAIGEVTGGEGQRRGALKRARAESGDARANDHGAGATPRDGAPTPSRRRCRRSGSGYASDARAARDRPGVGVPVRARAQRDVDAG